MEQVDCEIQGVNHPPHYKGESFECIDAMMFEFGVESVSHFCLLNAFKYLWRAGDKESVYKDIKKARWYIDKYNSNVRLQSTITMEILIDSISKYNTEQSDFLHKTLKNIEQVSRNGEK